MAGQEAEQMQARYEAIFQRAALGISLLDEQARFLQVNPAYERISGYSAHELIGMTIHELNHPDDVAANQQVLDSLYSGDIDEFDVEKRYVRKDGDTVWVHVSVSALDGPDGSRHALGLVQDISAHNQALERVRAERARFRAAADTALDGIISADHRGKMRYCNVAAAQMFGYEPEDLVGRSIEDIMPARFRDQHHEAMQRRVDEGWVGKASGRRAEFEGLRSDGSEFPLDISLAGWQEDGEQRFTAILRDITDRVQAEAKQSERERALAASNKQLEQFAYVASHDLQAPLRQVTAFTQLVQRTASDRLTEEENDWLQKAGLASQRMSAMVTSLLTFSQVQRAEMQETEVDLVSVVAQVVDVLKDDLDACGAKVTWSDLPVVLGNHALMGHLFQNLLQNAIKYRSDEPLHIHIEGGSEDDAHVVQVQDNGQGFDDAQAEKIFRMFHRLDPDEDGTGIGLALAQLVVERHGGSIRATASPGGGATFTITLPGRTVAAT